MSNTEKICALCERKVSKVTLHHLVPKEEGGRYTETVPLCQPCHSTIHNLFSNKELKKTFHTIQALRSSERLHNYLQWIRNTRIEQITNKSKRRRK